MKEVTIYLYPKCGTCRQAVKWFKSRDIEIHSVDIFSTPPSVEVLADLIAKSGLGLRQFFNVSGVVYREMKLKDRLPLMDDSEMIALLASNGRLIKRPIVTDGMKVTVGFKEGMYDAIWGSK